jgi:predicted secreted protein
MRATSIVMIYILFWWACLFLVLPFRLRQSAEPEDYVPGQAESAPPRFSLMRTLLWTTIVSAAAFGLFYANFLLGWITASMFDLSTLAGH